MPMVTINMIVPGWIKQPWSSESCSGSARSSPTKAAPCHGQVDIIIIIVELVSCWYHHNTESIILLIWSKLSWPQPSPQPRSWYHDCHQEWRNRSRLFHRSLISAQAVALWPLCWYIQVTSLVLITIIISMMIIFVTMIMIIINLINSTAKTIHNARPGVWKTPDHILHLYRWFLFHQVGWEFACLLPKR